MNNCSYQDVFLKIISNNTQIINGKLIKDNIDINILFHKTLASIKDLNNYYLDDINSNNIRNLDNTFPGIFKKVIDISNDNLTFLLYTGSIILYIEKQNIIYEVILKNQFGRSITKGTLEATNVFGAQDGFTEDIDKNLALINRKLKSSNLKNERFQIGNETLTELEILYLENKIDPNLLKETRKILSSINREAILNINDIASYFNKNSLFPLIAATSSPESACACLISKKIIIFIDQLPVCLIIPVNFNYFLTLNDESSAPTYYKFYTKILTFILLFFSVFFLGLYVAMIDFHPRSLSLLLLAEAKISLRGEMLPLIGEIIFSQLIFEFLKLGAIRTPASAIQNVIVIVGGLIIGQSAINSGIVSPFNLVITALCFLSTYSTSYNQQFVTSITLLRFFILLGSYVLGFYGFMITSIIAIIYLYNLKSVNISYLTPFAPFNLKNIKETFFKRKEKDN